MSIHLCIVFAGTGRGPFAAHLAAMAIQTAQAAVKVSVVNPQGSDLVAVRTRGSRAALEAQATHLLWLDDDMTFPADTALRLLAHDLPAVGVNYPRKTFRRLPTAANGITEDDYVVSVGQSGLEVVETMGFGVILIKREVFEGIEFPWFGHRWFYDLGGLRMAYAHHTNRLIGIPDFTHWRSTGEDVYFCERLRQSNIKLWVDHDLSLQVGHYGGCLFLHEGVSDLT